MKAKQFRLLEVLFLRRLVKKGPIPHCPASYVRPSVRPFFLAPLKGPIAATAAASDDEFQVQCQRDLLMEPSLHRI